MLDNPTTHQKKIWDLWAYATIKNEELLKQNLRSLYTVVMSLCDPIMENFASIKHTRDMIKLLQVIKHLILEW